MEQKRTLWIIVAAGVFLLVVLGAAYVFYAPAAGSNPPYIASSAINQPQVSSSGWTQASKDNSNLTPAPLASDNTVSVTAPVQNETHTTELTVYSDNTVVYDLNGNQIPATTIDLNALRSASETKNETPQNINITLNVPEPPVPPAEEPKSVKVVKQDEPKNPPKTEPVSEKKVASAPVKKAAPAAPKSSEAVAKVAEKKADQYWVQAAAYSTKKTAENARTVLDDNKIPADIFTYKDAKGKVFYRLRVGPYTTKSEAEYWRTRIVKINEFAGGESFVTLN